MRWSASHLISSRKDGKTSETVVAPECTTTSKRPNHEKWHRAVKESRDSLEFLVSGCPPYESIHLESLQRLTADYLRGCRTSCVRPSAECDEILGTLIDEHARKESLTKDVAVLACIYALSIPAAVRNLVSLMNLDVERYLRCITLAGRANPSIGSGEELRSAQSLLQILSSKGHDFQEFQHLIEALGLGAPLVLVPLELIQSILEKSGIRSCLQKKLDSHLEQKRFMSASLLVSWLQCVTKIQNSNIIAVLDKHFPSWPWLIAWRPNINRIDRWENGKFTDVQRKKLSYAFALDGPDTATHQKESLKLAETECYEHVHVQPKNKDSLERFLDLLYRAHMLGPGTLELFIYLCIDGLADETTLSMAEDAIKMGEDSFCNNLHMTLRALSPQSSLSSQMSGLIQALSIFNGRTPESLHITTDYLAGRLSGVMEAAQMAFCKQLENGPGDYLGMLIYDLSNAIVQASWIHSSLPSGLLAHIRNIPPQNTLEAIFDQLQDDQGAPCAGDIRFKSYLTSSLGGRAEAESGLITLAAIREEVHFWEQGPDTSRRDLAKMFEKVQSMDYLLYTSCLLVMLGEDDLFICEMRHIIKLEREETCFKFARYLAHRRGLNQLRHECWLLLLASLIKEQDPSFLPKVADSMSYDQWLELVDDLSSLLTPVQLRLPQCGCGLTQDRLLWWRTLKKNMTTVRFLLERQGRGGNLAWLYFPSHPDQIVELLDIIGQGQSVVPIYGHIVSCLATDGSNVTDLSDCIRKIRQTSVIGRAVCETIFSRKRISERDGWSEPGLSIVLETWHRSRGSLTQVDKSALDLIGKLLNLSVPPKLHTIAYRSACEQLQSEYNILLHRARELETFRRRFRHQNPHHISVFRKQLGIGNASSNLAAITEIPDELVDAVKLVGKLEYELSFALTCLSDLQRRARGISKDSRLLLVRLCLLKSPQFCIHFSPDDGGQGQHNYWRPGDNRETTSTHCTNRPNLFSYYFCYNLHQLLQRGYSSLQYIHSAILKLITAPPAACLVCFSPLNVKLWKPATCSKNCSIILRKAPLAVRLHNLLVDTLSIDLLLTCIYAAAADQSALKLLPGCPVQKIKIRAVIDSFQPLTILQKATDLRAAIRGYDEYGKDRENLLSWLCLMFRGFMLTAPNGFRIPSMPETQQFLMLNSNHERERLFDAQRGSRGSTSVVFHGTQVSRLFLILTEGLKSMSNTSFMLNGTALGSGIYCGDDQRTSLPYAGSTGQSWKNSALSNMKIMLGCELATYNKQNSGSTHLVTNQDSLLVRYIFLMPQAYQPPPRHHVESAMMTAFANLRTGLVN